VVLPRNPMGNRMVAHQRFEERLAFDAQPQTFPVLLVVIVCH
jgi:hypothetical protein